MARSFAGGLIWGIVVVGGGFAVLSQLAPLPQPTGPSSNGTVAGQVGGADTGSAPDAMAGAGKAGAGQSVSAGSQAANDAASAGTAGQVASAGDTLAQTSPGQTAPVLTPSAQAADPGEQQAGAEVVETQKAGTDVAGTDAAGKDAAGTDAAGKDAAGKDAAGSQAAETQATVAAKAAAQTDQVSKAPTSDVPAQEGAADHAVTLPGAQAAAVAEAPQPQAPAVPQAMTGAGALPQLPGTPAAAEPTPTLTALSDALKAPAVEPLPKASEAPAPDPLAAKDALLVPSQGAGLSEPSRLPQIATAPDPGLTPAPLPQVLAPAPDDQKPKAAAPLTPVVIVPDTPRLPVVKGVQSTMPTTLKETVPGVATNTLPHVGDQPKTDAVTTPDPAAAKPLVRYARKFEGAEGKPLFVILLQDVGSAGMRRADLAQLPFPVSFVIDPLAPDAKEAEATYRAAGQEVLMLANGLPQGATAGDVAQTFQTLADILPEAVGVIDMATLGFQNNRGLAALVLPVIADQGRGLVTYDQGLNAADQIARRDGLPAAVVFRRLDGAGESQPTIRRYLDRAAFKAAQEGSVVVLGDTRADTVAAILQWALEGKGGSVALAPVSAVMGHR